MKKRTALAVASTAILLVILASPQVMFDSSRPALLDDEEYSNVTGKPVAIGPRPRFLKPPVQDAFYRGDERVFGIYRSFCDTWVEKNGYSLPRWRGKP